MITRRRLRIQSGYTLVEVMVAAVVLGTSVSGVMSMLGTGRGLENSESLRRQARIFASNALEDTLKHYIHYPLAATANPPPTTTANLKTESDFTIAGDLFVTVWAVANDTWHDGVSPYNVNRAVPYQKIQAKVRWSLAGTPDSVVLWRRIAQAQ